MRVLFIILSLLLYLDPVYCKIIHVNRFDQIINEIQNDAVILIDVDHTLIESSLLIGTIQWNQHMRQTTLFSDAQHRSIWVD